MRLIGVGTLLSLIGIAHARPNDGRDYAAVAPPPPTDPCANTATSGFTKLATGGPNAPVGPMTARLDGGLVVIEGAPQAASYDPCNDSWSTAPAVPADTKSHEYNARPPIMIKGGRLLPGQDGSSYDFDAFAKSRIEPLKGKTVNVTAKNAPSPRSGYALVVTDRYVIVWGGADPKYKMLGDGAVLDLSTRRWRRMSMKGAPSARFTPVAAWTGTQLVIWGGAASLKLDDLSTDGAVYDVKTDRWTPMASAGAPPKRWKPITAWTGSSLVVMGGGSQRAQYAGAAHDLTDAFAYDLTKKTWQTIAKPPDLNEEHWIRTYNDGRDRLLVVDTFRLGFYQLDLPNGTFVDVKLPATLADRSGVASAWTGKRLVLYGGYAQAPGYQNPCANANRPCDPPSPPMLTFSDGWSYTP